MCGIAGVVTLDGRPIRFERTKGMCDVLSHRGPDGAGYMMMQTGRALVNHECYEQAFSDPLFAHQTPLLSVWCEHTQDKVHKWDLFLGHRRLSILDLTSAGFQPMTDIENSLWLTFNGEIYNYRELRTELIQLGYQFESDTDTEVLLYAYKAWGIECLHKFNGMFSFALYDKRHHQLYLARDRHGIKPLYYLVTESNELVFASEIKGILAYVDTVPPIDKLGLMEYFTFQNIFTDRTLHKGIALLPPASVLHLDLSRSNRSPTVSRYYDCAFIEGYADKSEGELLAELEHHFKQAVTRQLVSDVEVGCYLSGGLDSGAITTCASKELPQLKTFTVGFDLNNISGIELSYDERERAELLSYLMKTEQYEMVLKSGDMERCLEKFSWHIEEPRIGQSYPNYYASKLASKFVKVVLAGSGGDEIFAGYPWRYYRGESQQDASDYFTQYFQYWQRLVPNELHPEFFAPIWSEISHAQPQAIFESVFKEHAIDLKRPADFINHSLYFEYKTFLHGLLVVEDKLSMAHSLETRVPFLDNDLFDFATQVPVRHKLNQFAQADSVNENDIVGKGKELYGNNCQGKMILRKALTHLLPREYTHAKKQGFSSPDAHWFKGDSIEFIKKILFNPNSRLYEFFNFHTVKRLLEEHIHGERNRRLLIWSLISFHFFLHHYG